MERGQRPMRQIKIPKSVEAAVKKEIRSGMKKVADLQTKASLDCYIKNHDNMMGFVDCYRGFNKKLKVLHPLNEKRMAWTVYQLANCVNSGNRLSLTRRLQRNHLRAKCLLLWDFSYSG